MAQAATWRRAAWLWAALLLLPTPASATDQPAQLGPTPPEQPTAPPQLGPSPPEPAPPADGAPRLGENQLRLSADDLRADETLGQYRADGNVRLRWRDLDLSGRSLTFDRPLNRARMEGPATLLRDDRSSFTTQWIELDTDRWWSTLGPFEGQLSPQLVGRGAVAPLNLRGSDALSMRDDYFAAHNILLSSCDFNDLKYHLTARTVAVVPNRKIILRSARMYLFGVPVLALGKLVIPLREYRRTEWLPEFGRNDTYGFFARMRYFYDLADSQLGNLSGMLTEKRGTYWGLEHEFGYGRGPWRGIGDVDLEYGTRNADLSLRANLDQGMGRQTSLRMNAAFSQNSGFSSTSRQLNLTGLFNHIFDVGSTSLSFSRSQSESGQSRSVFSRYALNQRFNVGQVFSADLGADYSVRELSSQPTDKELQTRARLGGRWNLFDWELIDERRFDVEGSAFPGDDNRPVTEIVPQLTLRTDSRRLGVGLPDVLDLELDTSVGQLREFVDNPGDEPDSLSTVLRVNFDLQGRLNRIAPTRSTRLLADFRYSQSFFDHPDPSAKYIVAAGPRWEWKPSRYTRLDLGYRWQEVAGFSPLRRFDFAQTINDLDFGWSLFVPHPARPRNGRASIRLNGGYDFLTGRARDLRISAIFQPLDQLYLSFNTTYSLDGRGVGDAGFRSLRGLVQVNTGPRYQHEIGFTYDARNGKLDNIDSLLTYELVPKLIFQQALTWDGRSERVTYHDLLATLDMGCVQLVGTYRQQAQEYRLDLNITAFPGLSSLFGTGRFGQQFSTSQGFSY